MAAHRYWQISMAATASATGYAFAEIQFRTTAGTPLLFSGGTASATTFFAGFPASNAADNNTTTLWSSNGLVSGVWTYDYGAGVTKDIVEIVITARNDGSFNQAPTLFTPQWSDDGSTWTSMRFLTTTWASAGQTQVFAVTGPVSNSVLVTQSALEQFLTTPAPAQVTQVALEHWVTTATILGQAMVTQVALEQWARVPLDTSQARVMVMA